MHQLTASRHVKNIINAMPVDRIEGKRQSRKSGKLQSTATAFAVILFCYLQLSPNISTLSDGYAAASDLVTQNRPNLTLRVDSGNRARAFSSGLQPIISIADFFEFFERSLAGGSSRIALGPWNGSLRETVPGVYSLRGEDATTGAAYTIVFKQVDPNTIELLMSFRAPSRPSNLGFDILKLYSDLFKGSSVVASPVSLTDAGTIPVEPRPFTRRMLLTNKNRVRLKGAFCDLEITDMTESKTMYVADARNIPWDRHKSILFGADVNSLVPNRTYSFRYSIRSLPPTRRDLIAKTKASGQYVADINPWSFYALPPKQEAKEAGVYRLHADDAISGTLEGTAESILASELARTTAIRPAVRQLDPTVPRTGFYIERTTPGTLPSEGFEIIVTTEKVLIKGADDRGCLYGVYALMARLQRQEGAWVIPCGRTRDWPDFPIRGACMELLPPAIRDIDIFKRYLHALSRARSNVVIFLHDPRQIRAWLKHRKDGGWSRDQMAEIARYARALHMDVWGAMGSSFSTADFPEMDIRKGSNLYNPLSKKSYDYLFTLYDAILQAYQPSTLLISHDEIQGLSLYSSRSGKSTADLLAMDVKRIHAWLSQRNVRTAMWGDMLLDHAAWEAKVGSANSRNPAFNSGATHEALTLIPKDIRILDWHYDERPQYASIDHFRRNGFEVIGAPWHDAKAAKALATSVRQFKGQGVVATDWGFWITLSPAATTLFAPLCAWSSNCTVVQDNLDVPALAETVRDPVYTEYTYKQNPVNLAAMTNGKTRGGYETNWDGPFGIGQVLDLSGFQSGRQVLGGVTFETLSDDGGRQNNCVIVGNTDNNSDGVPGERWIFQGRRPARAIAFLHTCLVEEPQAKVRPLGKYTVEYEGGRSETIVLLESWNITDVRTTEGLRRNGWTFLRSPDVLFGSKPAWRGISAAGIPINVQAFVWNNPYPKEKINAIRLSTDKAPPNTRIALLGLTFLQ